MSCQVDNNAFEMVITPSRKRKRNSDRQDAYKCSSPALLRQEKFGETIAPPTTDGRTNAAFSSTPKKQAKFLINSYNRFAEKCSVNKENTYPVISCLEVKSISDIVATRKSETTNPFEVIRKPPKKKKKADINEVCFVNPALNLDVPEKKFNPFEVHRSPPPIPKERTCFINSGLNIRVEDNIMLNPFEITRLKTTPTIECPKDGIENLALEMPPSLAIGIPFTPRVGCRIDFKNFQVDSLTPSKLFAEKLVFSPVNPIPKTPRTFAGRRSLSAISEEAVDIGKELDCYQLELENSINEAKMRKANGNGGDNFNEIKRGRVSLCSKLEEIEEFETEDNKIDDLTTPEEDPKTPIQIKAAENAQTLIDDTEIKTDKDQILPEAENPTINVLKEQSLSQTEKFSENIEITENKEDSRVSDNDSFFDDDLNSGFKAPTPFVRAYRKAEPRSQNASKESINSDHKTNSKENIADGKNKVSGLIRKSIRRLMHPVSGGKTADKKLDEKPIGEPNKPHQLLENIRHSLRRRPNKTPNISTDTTNDHEVSIIDVSERTSKFKSNLIHTDYLRIEEVTKEPKISLRSSIRKSTREMKNHVLKSVFKKNVEEYQFKK